MIPWLIYFFGIERVSSMEFKHIFKFRFYTFWFMEALFDLESGKVKT